MGQIPFKFDTPEDERRFNFIEVDTWVPQPMNLNIPDIFNQDTIFTNNKGAIIAPINWFFQGPEKGLGQSDIDYFVMSTKKCYNSVQMRNHTCLYLNYFERFYDVDKEYFMILANMKYVIDVNIEYSKAAFIYDIKRYILSQSILQKTYAMCKDNYQLNLAYKNISNPSLQYTDDHATILMQMSLIMNLIIPLLTHFAYKRKITAIDDFLLDAFDEVFNIFDSDSTLSFLGDNVSGVDMYNKIYETSTTNIAKNEQNNKGLWMKQDIRGKNSTTHSLSSVDNIILNIMPKYVFSQNVVSYNYASINNNTSFQITDISYEFNYISLSSSKRDEDSISEFDKYEGQCIKQNEAIYLQSKINAHETLNTLNTLFGPFDEEQVEYYAKVLNMKEQLNTFQKQLILNMFFKYFGDTVSAYAINRNDIVKLMLTAKKILINNGMIILPYVLSGKVEKLVLKKCVNKKDLVNIQSSPNYKLVLERYNNNEKIIKHILSIIATIISSDFKIIDPDNPQIHGKMIDPVPAIIAEEVLLYSLLI